MNPIRPPVLEAALRSCTRSQPSPAFRNALQQRLRAPQRRCMTGGRGTPTPPGSLQKSTVWMPKTRIAVGIVFIGSLIYSMATGDAEPHVPPPQDPTQSPPPRSGQQLDAPSIAERDVLLKRESGVSQNSPMRLRMEQFIKQKQQEIVRALEAVDGNKFHIDEWDRPHGGGGISCVLQDGNVFEKAGVNISVVYGTLPRAAISKMRVNHKALDPDVESLEFFASGLSLVLNGCKGVIDPL